MQQATQGFLRHSVLVHDELCFYKISFGLSFCNGDIILFYLPDLLVISKTSSDNLDSTPNLPVESNWDTYNASRYPE